MVLRSESIGIEKKFLELCNRVAIEIGLNIYDLQYIKGSQTLKVFVQDPSTDTALIEDCVKMDRALTPYIEELDWMPEALVLEVSSPGVFRDLNRIEHFKSVLDQRIELHLKRKLSELVSIELPKKLMNEKKIFGVLKDSFDSGIDLELENNNVINIDYTNIKRANLGPSFN